MRCEYRPLSLSLIASRNHTNSVRSQITMPSSSAYLPQATPLTHWPAPTTTKNRPRADIAGCDDGLGT